MSASVRTCGGPRHQRTSVKRTFSPAVAFGEQPVTRLLPIGCPSRPAPPPPGAMHPIGRLKAAAGDAESGGADKHREGPMSDVHDLTQNPPSKGPAPDEPPLPWDHWSKERRQWTALGIAAGVLLLGAVAGLVALWS